jgi:hypothetical protein
MKKNKRSSSRSDSIIVHLIVCDAALRDLMTKIFF